MNNKSLAYIIGAAIGDGNLSNPNGRAVRLRITCDTKYPKIIKRLVKNIQQILPNNKISQHTEKKGTYLNISCYSNQWEKLLGWQAKAGPKEKQKIRIPKWIKRRKELSSCCLKGLFETDGSVYLDRGYRMVNFVTIMPGLAKDVLEMISSLGFEAHIYQFQQPKSVNFTIRLSREVDQFIKLTGLEKA